MVHPIAKLVTGAGFNEGHGFGFVLPFTAMKIFGRRCCQDKNLRFSAGDYQKIKNKLLVIGNQRIFWSQLVMGWIYCEPLWFWIPSTAETAVRMLSMTNG